MKIAISGASGLIGSALATELRQAGHAVCSLVRREPVGAEELHWSPETGQVRLAGPLDAVVHLAGENIAGGRWTDAQKKLIRDSRVQATERLARFLAGLSAPPGIFIAASAVGFYGNRGEEILTEDSGPGQGFLANVTAEWEAATKPLRSSGTRIVHLRFGMILSAAGGALRKMLPVFRSGGGGKAGDGRQWVNWVTRRDAVRATHFCLQNNALFGPVNCVAPEPVRNEDFAKKLGAVLNRPAIVPAPRFALRIALGEMADELLLASQRAVPKRLLDAGFTFEHPQLESALESALGDQQ